MPLKHNDRIGQLCREGKPIYYAVLGRVLYEHPVREKVVEIIDRNAAKLPAWDRLRLE